MTYAHRVRKRQPEGGLTGFGGSPVMGGRSSRLDGSMVGAEAPKHPYTQALFASAPTMDPSRRLERPPITGDPPNPVNPPSGCRFRTRCAYVMPRCAEAVPPPILLASDHAVACYLYDGEATHAPVLDSTVRKGSGRGGAGAADAR